MHIYFGKISNQLARGGDEEGRGKKKRVEEERQGGEIGRQRSGGSERKPKGNARWESATELAQEATRQPSSSSSNTCNGQEAAGNLQQATCNSTNV